MLVDVPGIPCRRRTGEVVYALVDPEDFVWLNEWRWFVVNDEHRLYVYRGNPRASAGPRRRYMHREIMGLPASGDGWVVDHINRNPLDNRRENLRVVTHRENCQNQPSKAGTSRFRGVSHVAGTKRWRAQVSKDGRNYFLGEFAREEEAAAIAAAFRAEHMPYSEEAAA